MYCPQCGTPLSGTANFCPKCGSSVANNQSGINRAVIPPKKRSFGSYLAIILVACFLISSAGYSVYRLFNESDSDGPKTEKSDSLFSGLVDYKIDGLIFRTPDDIRWDDEDFYDDSISLESDELSVNAEIYYSKDLKSCDVSDEDEFIEYVVDSYDKKRGVYDISEVESFSSGSYVTVKGERSSYVVGIYMNGKKAWVIEVKISDPAMLDEYSSTAEMIATSGIIGK